MEIEEQKSVEVGVLEPDAEVQTWSDCNNTDVSTQPTEDTPSPKRYSGNQSWLNSDYKRQRVNYRGKRRGRGGGRHKRQSRASYQLSHARAYQDGFQAGFNQALHQQQRNIWTPHHQSQFVLPQPGTSYFHTQSNHSSSSNSNESQN